MRVKAGVLYSERFRYLTARIEERGQAYRSPSCGSSQVAPVSEIPAAPPPPSTRRAPSRNSYDPISNVPSFTACHFPSPSRTAPILPVSIEIAMLPCAFSFFIQTTLLSHLLR